jgi:hypothetical protein
MNASASGDELLHLLKIKPWLILVNWNQMQKKLENPFCCPSYDRMVKKETSQVTVS